MVLTDPPGERRVQFGELGHGFADDLELPLDGRAQHDIGQVLIVAPTVGELRYQRRRLLNIVEIGPGVRPQR